MCDCLIVMTNKQLLRQTTPLELKFIPKKSLLVLKGPRGILCYTIQSKLNYLGSKKNFWLTPKKFSSKESFHLNQVLLAENCLGVTLGYRCQLNLAGIGYQASIEKREDLIFLALRLGFSHQLKILVPLDLKVSCPKPRVVLITGISLQRVNNFAAFLRSLKLPNPYKEKGIYYKGEPLKLKQGKKT